MEKYLYIFTAMLFIPLGIALYDEFIFPESHPQPFSSAAFMKTIGISSALSLMFRFLGNRSSRKLYRRDGIFLVSTIWFVSGFIGCLPFYLSGTLEKPIDAYFETISALTTTGASVMCPKSYSQNSENEILINKVAESTTKRTYSYYGTIKPVVDKVSKKIIHEGIEAVSRAVLFWRSFMQWLGGMGIVVLFVAMFSLFGIGGKMLYQSEVPGPIKDTLTPRAKETAISLWKIYCGLSMAEVILLMVTNPKLSAFHAVAITFSTISTGGFTMTNESIASYKNVMTEWVSMIFMLIGSINFTIYFYCIQKKWKKIRDDSELSLYLITILLGGFIVSFNILGTEKQLLSGEVGTFSLEESLRYGFYHYISAQTSTGFATANYDLWPEISQLVMFVGMFLGGMAGSTGGGMKMIRHCIAFKVIKNQIKKLFKPNNVILLTVDGQKIDDSVVFYIFSFFVITIALSVVGTFIFTFTGIDLETSIGINACMLNNIGIAFRSTGPTDTFAFLSPLAKVVSLLWMILGRLEYFALITFLIPSFWDEK